MVCCSLGDREVTGAFFRTVQLTVVLGAAVWGAQAQQGSAVRRETVPSAIRTLFDVYLEHFRQGRSKEIAETVYRAPVWIGATPPRNLATTAEVEAFFSRSIGAIKEAGYSHSEILDLEIRQLNPSAALADLAYRRYLEGGAIMGPPVRRATYIVLHTQDGWRISGLIGHRN